MIRIIEVNKKILIGAIGLLLALPLAWQFLSGQGSARFSGLSFLSDSGPASRVNELRGEHKTLDNIFSKVVHNKLTAYGPNFLGHYLDHFSGNFLFINGDPLVRNKVPDIGQFYLIESLFLIIGLISLIKRKFEHTKLLISWILIAPLASSITYQTPHALRALNMVIPLTLIMGYGIWQLMEFKEFSQLTFRKIFLLLLVFIFSFEFIHYLESYYIHYPKRYPIAWEYGFKEMVTKLNSYESLYNSVVITDRYDQPYILVLFYKQYDPKKYQPQAILSSRDKFNFGTVRNFDKYEFHSIKSEDLGKAENTLFIGTPLEIPEDANIIDKVYFPNGEVAFVFVST